MKNILKQAGIYRLVIVIGLLFTINSLASSIMISFMNVSWTQLDGTSKFILIVGIIQSWTGTMLAFSNKTLARIESGKPPIDTGNTEIITKDK